MLNNPIDPLCPEQSLIGLLSSLGILDDTLYFNLTRSLVRTGKIRYTDQHMIEAVFQSVDGQHQITAVKTRRTKLGQDIGILAYFHRLFPGPPELLAQREYRTTSDFNRDLRSAEGKRLNLRQHKTTLNTNTITFPHEIRRGLAAITTTGHFNYI